MKTVINGKKVNVKLTHLANDSANEKDIAISLTVNGWFVLEITKKGELRRCVFACNEDNGLKASRTDHDRIVLKKGF